MVDVDFGGGLTAELAVPKGMIAELAIVVARFDLRNFLFSFFFLVVDSKGWMWVA